MLELPSLTDHDLDFLFENSKRELCGFTVYDSSLWAEKVKRSIKRNG